MFKEQDNVTPTKITLTPKQRQKIKRAVKALNEVREELEPQCEFEVGITWYLEDSGNLNLMDGDSHLNDYGQSMRQNGVIETFDLEKSSGGGW